MEIDIGALVDEAIEDLHRSWPESPTIERAIQFAYHYNYCSIINFIPWQHADELRKLMALVSERGVRRVLEIGTGFAGLAFALSMILPDGFELFTVDKPESQGGMPEFRDRIVNGFGRGRSRAKVLRYNSLSMDGYLGIVRDVGEEPVDFLFIDGDHTELAVRSDYSRYSELVRPGGIIGFHDITLPSIGKLWNELKENSKYFEFLENPEVVGFGIGVIEK